METTGCEHTGEVPAGKGQLPIEGAGGDDKLSPPDDLGDLGARRPGPIENVHGEPVLIGDCSPDVVGEKQIERAGHAMGVEDIDQGAIGREVMMQMVTRGDRPGGRVSPVLAAERPAGVEQRDTQSTGQRGGSGSHPGRPSADDDEVTPHDRSPPAW